MVSTARTPIGKAYRGAFNDTHGAVLGAHAVRHAVERAGLAPDEIEDLIMGTARPEGSTGMNIGRIVAPRA
ncbi:acetyl-CoA C-acyltransferase, partial [Verminephrobacter sp. Larva24]